MFRNPCSLELFKFLSLPVMTVVQNSLTDRRTKPKPRMIFDGSSAVRRCKVTCDSNSKYGFRLKLTIGVADDRATFFGQPVLLTMLSLFSPFPVLPPLFSPSVCVAFYLCSSKSQFFFARLYYGAYRGYKYLSLMGPISFLRKKSTSITSRLRVPRQLPSHNNSGHRPQPPLPTTIASPPIRSVAPSPSNFSMP